MRRIHVLLTAAIVVTFFCTTVVVYASDVATPVEAETFDVKPTGTSVVTDATLYSNSQALRFSNSKAVATEGVNFTSPGDVVLKARAGQKGARPSSG